MTILSELQKVSAGAGERWFGTQPLIQGHGCK